jgi:putative pyoverdin transport system ATP-binding/permease protein
MRKIIQFFLTSSFTGRSTKILLAAAIALSLVGGAANIALLALVTRRLSGQSGLTWTFVFVLLGLGALLGITRGAAQYLLTKVTIDTLLGLRMEFCRAVTSAQLAVLEQLGSARLTAAFTENMPSISNALVQLPNVVLYSIVAGGSIVYMGWLSWQALLLILGAGALFLVSYRFVNKRAQTEFGKAFVHYRAVLKGFRELVDGAKELKLHRRRRQAHLETAIGTPLNGLARHRVKSSFLYGAAEAWSTTGMFFAIAMVLMFAQGKREIGTGFVVALLYLMPFIQGILSTMPAFTQAETAVKTVQDLINKLAQSSDVAGLEAKHEDQWGRIALENVSYRYDSGDPDSSFRVGPMDFSLASGEVIFVTGGNGSGKTTFIKVLSGLYYPQAGAILVDGVPVAAAEIDKYRQRFSSVFFDFHLFDQFYGLTDVDDKASSYLKQLRLDHKVSVESGKLSTTNLSQGQRKRLALLTAYLEDRPIYIFDEWAADQDFEFRELFYYEIIPGLKRRNKTVVVISHDERYFHLADRVIKLELGQVVRETENQKLETDFSMSMN